MGGVGRAEVLLPVLLELLLLLLPELLLLLPLAPAGTGQGSSCSASCRPHLAVVAPVLAALQGAPAGGEGEDTCGAAMRTHTVTRPGRGFSLSTAS
jgi:hypothetical protein